MKTFIKSTVSIALLQQDLRNAVAELTTVNPIVGLCRFGLLGCVFISFVVLAWSTQQTSLFVAYTAIAGLFYAFWLVCTHDTTHHTLTGWRWFDELMPRLISYPMLWTYGAYAQLHRLHHGWNGIDLRDPERVQWTVAEYQQANFLLRWYVRHQWTIDLLLLGGVGLISKTILTAVQLQSQQPSLRRALILDAIGIFAAQIGLLSLALFNNRLGDYLLFWLLLERIIGLVVQARGHLEHYGLWGSIHSHQLTQFYACRNLKVSPVVAWLMGGLNNHSAHHAFPHIPFNQLPEATKRIQAVLKQYDLPELTIGEGYLREVVKLSQTLELIPQVNHSDR
ncbi:fatty acid desaturase [Phormidium tenue FACHB-886]|nr:fatty acid desaturase [Phormidium tenue FACHB-886]